MADQPWRSQDVVVGRDVTVRTYLGITCCGRGPRVGHLMHAVENGRPAKCSRRRQRWQQEERTWMQRFLSLRIDSIWQRSQSISRFIRRWSRYHLQQWHWSNRSDAFCDSRSEPLSRGPTTASADIIRVFGELLRFFIIVKFLNLPQVFETISKSRFLEIKF